MSLTLVYFRVNELEFKFNESVQPNTAFQIKPKIECKIAKKEDTLFVNLGLKINEDLSSPVPFNLKVKLGGTFKMRDGAVLDDSDMKTHLQEAFAMLYPYLRQVVSTFTLNCNIPAYILPTVMPDQLVESEQVDKFVIKKPLGFN